MEWDRDRLLMELPRFSFRKKPVIIGEVEKYHEYYGTLFTKSFPGLEQRIGWIDANDFRIVLQTFVPLNVKATVFLFHGYFDHAGIYKHLIRFLLSSGFAVVIYDMPGHGLSSGKPASINSFQQYQDALDACLNVCKKHLPEPFHAVGQSTGGAVLIDRMMQERVSEDPFDKVVLLAPLVRPVGWQSIKRLHGLLKPFLHVWFRSFSQNSNDVRFVTFLKEHDPLQSKWLAVDWVGALKDWIPRIENGKQLQRKILIVQGDADKTVDWEHNLDVLKRLFKELKITHIEGARHHLVNESLSKRQAVFDAVLSELSG